MGFLDLFDIRINLKVKIANLVIFTKKDCDFLLNFSTPEIRNFSTSEIRNFSTPEIRNFSTPEIRNFSTSEF